MIIILLAAVIITSAIINHSLSEYNKKIEQESISTRIFAIDVKNNKVTFFNRSDMKNKREMELSSFYFHFHQNDTEKVQQWIYSIVTNPKGCDQYLEADVLVNRGRATYFSLLKLIKYDPKVGIIHIESHILKYITPTNFSSKNKGALTGVVKRSVIKGIIDKNKSLRGFTFAIRFFYIRQKALSNEKIERYMMMTLKNEVYPYANRKHEPRQIIDDTGNEILLFDLHIQSRIDAVQLAASISHSLKKCIGVNGYSDSVDFAIGVVENAQFYQDFDSIVQKAQEACITAQQNDQEIFVYQKSRGPMAQELSKFNDEIDKLLDNNNLRYLFRTIVDSSRTGSAFGYFEYVRAYDSPFSNFAEMSKYAARVGRNRELFANIARTVIPKFASERPNQTCRLFLSVSMMDIDHMAEILPQIPASKEIRLVLVFDEQEVNENSSQLELLNNSLTKFRKLGYEIALLLQDKNLLLDPSVYTNFDYFVAGAAMMGEIKKDNRVRLSIHTLIESLLKYNQPIIATDLEGWQAVELIIKSGISIVSSEVISPSNDMLLPVEKKKITRLHTMYENFR
ncbi:MAG: hypothetical protein IJK27_05845 [Bacilli bacterium]|nr:hypothetical protein [Bacilli bacterium]